MGNLLEAGGGVSAAPLTALWRGVYRKGLELAEARIQALLAQHVQERHGRRALAVVIGGAGVLTPGVKCDLEAPWSYVVEGWSLYADVPGSVVVDLQVAEDFAVWPVTGTICGGNPPTLVAGDKAQDFELGGWTRELPRGRVIRVTVASASTLSLVTLNLFVRQV